MDKRKLITSDESIIKSMENEEWVKKSLFQRKSISLLVLILLASNVHSDDILNQCR